MNERKDLQEAVEWSGWREGGDISNNTKHSDPEDRERQGETLYTFIVVVVAGLSQWERVEEGRGGSGREEVGT